MPRTTIFLTSLLIWIAGCATERTVDTDRSDDATAALALADAAAAESDGTTTIVDVPPPPGVAESALAPITDAAALARATTPLDEVLAELAEAPPTPVVAPPLPEVQENEAVRRYLAGREEAAQGRHPAAITQLEQARQLDPTSVPILRELAHSYVAQRNAGRAIALYEEIVALDPMHGEALFTLGLAASNRRDFERAVALLARRRVAGLPFDHDPGAPVIADYTLHVALEHLGFLRASIELGLGVVDDIDLPSEQASGFRLRLASIYRQRGDILRSIGDARCRLGAPAAALESYTAAGEYPVTDPSALVARHIYVNLRLGRPRTAQSVLVESLRARATTLGDRDVALSSYLRENIDDPSLAAAALVELFEAHPDQPALARTAAQMLDPARARELLLTCLRHHPRDVELAGALLAGLALRDPAAALDGASRMIESEPDLAGVLASRLVAELSDPAAALEAWGAPAQPSDAVLDALVRERLWDLGGAWSACAAALERWPDDPALRRLRIGLAGRLDEPVLVDTAIEAAGAANDPLTWIARSEALRATERASAASDAALEAVAAADRDGAYRYDARVELARATAAMADSLPPGDQRTEVARQAASLGDRAREFDPDRIEAYDLLATLFSANGLLPDPRRYGAVGAQVRRRLPSSALAARFEIEEELRRGRLDAALEIATRVYEADPTSATGLELALVTWMRLDRPAEALAWLREQHRRRLDDVVLLDRYVRYLVVREQVDEAAALVAARRARFGDDPVTRRIDEMTLRAQGRMAEALELIERRLLARPEGSRRALQLALVFTQAGRQRRAAQEIRWLIDHADVASMRHLTAAIGIVGRLRLGTLGLELRADLAEATVRQYPALPLSIYADGIEALVELDAPRARLDAMLARALDHAPGDGTIQGLLPWRDLAQRLVDGGAPDLAADALRRRLERGPIDTTDASTLLVTMILAATAITEDDGASAVALLRTEADAGRVPLFPTSVGPPTLPQSFADAGSMYTLIGNERGADTLLEAAIDLVPDDGMSMNNLGYARIEAGRRDDETIAYIERAIELRPRDPSVLDTVGWLRYLEGRFEAAGDGSRGALELIEAAIDRSETRSAEMYDHYGDTLWRLGRADGAVDAWREVARILNEPERRDNIIRNYTLLQSQGWGLLVVDPEEMYDRDFGSLLRAAEAKLAAVERNDDPEVAPTFAEQGAGARRIDDAGDPPMASARGGGTHVHAAH